MDSVSLSDLADQHLEIARSSNSGRSAHTVHGGHGHQLRQTLIALASGRDLSEHHSPGETTLQVLRGHVRSSRGANLSAVRSTLHNSHRHFAAMQAVHNLML